MIELTLSEWAFLDAYSHLGDQLPGRTVILHIRSMTIIEILEADKVLLNEDTLKVSFKNTSTGEQLIAVLHFSTTVESKPVLIDILKKCATWYCEYCDWEDKNIIDDYGK